VYSSVSTPQRIEVLGKLRYIAAFQQQYWLLIPIARVSELDG